MSTAQAIRAFFVAIVSALDGRFGDFHLTCKTHGSRLWISPLMPILWFFEFEAVARRNLVLDEVAQTLTFREAAMKVIRQQLPRRPHGNVPL